MSEETQPEVDARGAAFASSNRKKRFIEHSGCQYEVRLPSMKTVDEINESKESTTRRGVRMIIACTYWPAGTPPDSKGKARAGTPMFDRADFELILAEDADPGSLWTKVLQTVAEMRTKVPTVEEAKGNSEASPGNATS